MTPGVPADTVGAFVGPPALLAAGAPTGPLAGTTLAVKDLFDVAGTVTGAGNPDFSRDRPVAEDHAPAVRRLVEAGASVVGKTVTDELAYSLSGTNVHHGAPRNPAAPDAISGGSSAGSASAVAAGLADLGLGTDTGGSIRVPASYCGIVGWRPTHGPVAIDGVVPLAPSFDTVGLLGRDLDLVARAADVLLGAAPEGPPVRRAVLLGEARREVAPDLAVAVADAARALGAGDELAVGCDLDRALAAFRDLQGAEAWAAHGAWIEQARPTMGPGIAGRFAAAAQVTPDQVAAARQVRTAVRDAVATATADGTVLLSAAAPGPAPRRGGDVDAYARTRVRTLRLTCLAGLAGAPVVVLPLVEADGGPVGVAALGAPGTDRALLAWAREVAG